MARSGGETKARRGAVARGWKDVCANCGEGWRPAGGHGACGWRSDGGPRACHGGRPVAFLWHNMLNSLTVIGFASWSPPFPPHTKRHPTSIADSWSRPRRTVIRRPSSLIAHILQFVNLDRRDAPARKPLERRPSNPHRRGREKEEGKKGCKGGMEEGVGGVQLPTCRDCREPRRRP